MKKFDQLTSVRFLASALIILHHLGGAEIPILKIPVSLAVYSIGFFFVLSGFVMTIVYFDPDKPFSFRDFWVARISRIFPVFLFSFALTAIHYADALAKMKTGEYLASVLLLQAWIPKYALTMNFPAWTLSVEMFFYLLFPFIVYLAKRGPFSRLIWAALGVWLVIQFARQYLIRGPFDLQGNFLAYFPLFHLDSFLVGMAAGMWYLAVGRKIEIGQRAVSTILVSCAAFFLSAHFLGVTRFLGSFHGFFSPLFAVVIIMLTLDRSSASRVLSQRWLVVLGESSYALYIIHIPLLWLFESALKGMGIDRSYLLGFGVYLPLVIFLSILTFRRVEWPAQDWLRKNPGTVLVFLLDTLLVSAAIYLAYLARVGLDVRHFDREIAFSIRMGLPIVLLSLAVFGFYKTPASILEWRWVARRLFVPLAAAAGVLGLALWLARNDGLIDSFPRTLPLIAFAALFGVLYASRVILRRWRTQLSSFA